MKWFHAVPLVCALILGSSLPAETFEGELSMKLIVSSGAPQYLELIAKEGFIRGNLQNGQMSIISDLKAGTLTVLMIPLKMYAVSPLPTVFLKKAEALLASSTIKTARERDRILGYDCVKVVATNADGSTELWITDKIGNFSLGGGFSASGVYPPSLRASLHGRDIFPLRLVSKKGGSNVRIDVISVRKKREPDSEFMAPRTWKKFEGTGTIGQLFN